MINSLEAKKRQLIFYLTVESKLFLCYAYIHADDIMHNVATKLATETWTSLRHVLRDCLLVSRVHLGSDQTPYKLVYLVEVAASWFSSSP